MSCHDARSGRSVWVTVSSWPVVESLSPMTTTEDPDQCAPIRPVPSGIWTISGKHPTTGRALACSNGAWSGDKALLNAARTLCEARSFLPLGPYGPMVAADASDPLAVTAVVARSPGGGSTATSRGTGWLPLPAPRRIDVPTE